ncbi:formimidoylglutamate deiminase [Salaquimonas pukyongi]|uniref:formimidoylglutamate deiminase n=1 Tax=Salaquimonas pukyongi TaxID=2712698 RepID=UPI00096B77CD|nr:formimidoylglutamate deiminase [Salaquimonas pukyongi]
MTRIWAEQALLQDGWRKGVLVEIGAGGTIKSLATDRPKPDDAYSTGILLPAPANAHSHAFQRAMAGLTEMRGPDARDSFWTWRQLMYRFLERLTPDHVETIAALVQMEMLEAGYATNVEFHYLHHQPDGMPYDNLAEMAERIGAAAEQTGIGLTLLPVHYQYGGCDQRPLGSGQIRFGNDMNRFENLHAATKEILRNLPADSAIGTAPHSLRAIAAEDFARHMQLRGNGPLHMHLAEQKAEVAEVEAAHGLRPVEWVLRHGAPDERCCFIHCTRMKPDETAGLARSGAVAGLCPITESSLGDGVFDGVRWFENAGSIAIGSDSNIRISLSEELRTLEYSQRLRDHSRAALATPEKSTGRHLLEAMNTGGATAAGRNCGAIAKGMLADLFALDAKSIHLAGRQGDAILDSFIFAGDDRMISDVWSAGRHMVQAGQHVNRGAIVRRYLHTMEEIGGAI